MYQMYFAGLTLEARVLNVLGYLYKEAHSYKYILLDIYSINFAALIWELGVSNVFGWLDIRTRGMKCKLCRLLR